MILGKDRGADKQHFRQKLGEQKTRGCGADGDIFHAATGTAVIAAIAGVDLLCDIQG